MRRLRTRLAGALLSVLTPTATACGGGSASVRLIGGKGSGATSPIEAAGAVDARAERIVPVEDGVPLNHGARTGQVPESVVTRLYGGGA